jgi:hypothetical protein
MADDALTGEEIIAACLELVAKGVGSAIGEEIARRLERLDVLLTRLDILLVAQEARARIEAGMIVH